MPTRSDRLQKALSDIRALDPSPVPATLDALRDALASKTCHVVAAAAAFVEAHELTALTADLAAAWPRFVADPVKRDPNCTAKLALIRALSALDAPDPDPFLGAVATVQLEPSWGPPVDTAVQLRCVALMALVGLSHPDFPLLAAELLSDPDPHCRGAAAQCLAAWKDAVWGQALIRLRLQSGESDPDVLTDCFEAILSLGGAAAVETVARELAGDDPRSAAAALALGTSRMGSALQPLQRWWAVAIRADHRRIGLIAIGLLRNDDALAFLIRVLTGREGARRDADDALEALAVYAHDPRAAIRIAEAAEEVGLGPRWREQGA